MDVFTRRCVLRPQPFATVRKSPREVFYGRASGGLLQKWSLLKVSNVAQPRFRLTGVALCHIPTWFHNVSKVIRVTVPLARFAEDGSSCIFRRRRSTLETSIVIF